MYAPYPGNHDLNKFRLTLLKDISTKDIDVLVDWFLRRFKKKHSLNIHEFLWKNLTPHCGLHPYPDEHILNNCESTLPDDATTQVIDFLTNLFI